MVYNRYLSAVFESNYECPSPLVLIEDSHVSIIYLTSSLSRTTCIYPYKYPALYGDYSIPTVFTSNNREIST